MFEIIIIIIIIINYFYICLVDIYITHVDDIRGAYFCVCVLHARMCTSVFFTH